jgi:hypothetical protein
MGIPDTTGDQLKVFMVGDLSDFFLAISKRLQLASELIAHTKK